MLLTANNSVAIFQWGVVLGASLAAALWDIRSRRIPNVLTLPLFAAGLVQAAMFSGWDGFKSGFLAAILLALPYVILFIFAGGGAGDAKLMAAAGAWLGLSEVPAVLIFVSLFGIVMALLKAAYKGRFFEVLNNIQGMIVSFFLFVTLQGVGKAARTALAVADHGQDGHATERLTVPYGPAIFAGVLCAAIYRFISS